LRQRPHRSPVGSGIAHTGQCMPVSLGKLLWQPPHKPSASLCPPHSKQTGDISPCAIVRQLSKMREIEFDMDQRFPDHLFVQIPNRYRQHHA
jgi:hypothetical protein